MKKIATIWFCLVLLSAFAFPLPTAAETGEIQTGVTEEELAPLPGEAETLLENGDFEAGADGVPERWSSKVFSETAGAWLITGSMARSGNSVKLTGGTGTASYPFVQQGIPVEGGATYQLSLWLRKDGGKAAATTKLEFYASAVTGSVCVQGANTYKITSTNGWEHVLYNFRAPYTATSVLIMPRIESESETAYYDDVKVYKVGPPAPVNLETDSIFYYPEQKTGTAVVAVSDLVLPAAEDGSAVFSILDGDAVLTSAEVPLGKTFKGSFSYDISLLKELKKEYTVRVVIHDKNGARLAERTQPIYKFNRPAYLDRDGVWQSGNEVFTPVIAYKVPATDAAYIKCKKAGITVVQGDVSDLARAHSHGLKVLVTLYNGMQPAGAEANRENTKAVVEKYKNDSRVFAWAVMDEPHLNLPEPMDALRESYRLIREIDDNHPVYICEASPQHFEATAKVCDLLCTDPYLPGSTTVPGKMNTTHVYEYVQKARAASNFLKPVLSLQQAFTWYRYLPDGDAERHMTYQAMLAGTSAHGYYNLSQAAEENGKTVALYEVTSTDIWDGICSFAANEQADVYKHFVEKKYPGFSHYAGKDVMYHGYIKNGKLYLIVLNQSSTETVKAEIPLASFDGSIKIGSFSAKYIVGGGGSLSGNEKLSVSLPPYNSAVLEITPQGTALSGLSDKAFWNYVEKVRREENSQVIQNGGFEGKMNENTPLSWECAEGFGEAAVLLSEEGEQFLRIGGGGRIGVSTKLSLIAGTIYKLQLDARGADAALGIEGIIDCRRIGVAASGAEEWVEDFSYFFEVPETGSYTVTLYSHGGGTADFDNVSLESFSAGMTEKTDEAISASFILPYEEREQNVKLLLTEYSADGELIGMKVQAGKTENIPFADNTGVCTETTVGTIPAILSVSMPKKAEDVFYKVFVWEGICPIVLYTERITP